MYFFDTYALVELTKNNASYDPFASFPLITTALNVGEYYEFLIRTFGPNPAKNHLHSLTFRIIDITPQLAEKAVLLRRIHRKKKFSWADSIGYCAAKEHELIFLTGDKEFKHLDNVRHIK